MRPKLEIQKLTLPRGIGEIENPIVSRLEQKALEYMKRLRNERFDMAFQAPEQRKNPVFDASNRYKADILTHLLTDGELDTQKLYDELESRGLFLNADYSAAYVNAVGVIEDYIKTGGENVRGGTGF